MGIPVLRGRDVVESDGDVMLVSRNAAKLYWGNDDPIGRRAALPFSKTVLRRVVGIVGDVKQRSLIEGAAAAQTPRIPPPRVPETAAIRIDAFHAPSRFASARSAELLTMSSKQVRPSAARGKRSVARQIGGTFIGSLLGFYLGAQMGAALEGNSCQCDDPGLRGLMIGAPAGAVIGGVIGARLTR